MSSDYPNAVAVFCGSNIGNDAAFSHAARSLGRKIAESGLGLVYGGGSKGIMGVVSGAALFAGAKVTGVVPYAMVKDHKEVRKNTVDQPNGSESSNFVMLNEQGREKMETIVVQSMHERKVEMSKRVRGFLGLPGGFGTFEELLEVITWTQLDLHSKPVVLLNVLGFYDPLRELIKNGVLSGFIQPHNENIVVFVDGPQDLSAHDSFDWGTPALEALNSWKRPVGDSLGFDWKKRLDETDKGSRTALDMS